MLPCLFLVSGNPPESVAVVWLPEATADRATQQRLVTILETSLSAPPKRVMMGALDRARRVAAYEVGRDAITAVQETELRLQRAQAQFRAGELDAAEKELEVSMAILLGDPTLPGAARSAYAIHLLEARIAWARGDLDAARMSMLDALTLDPTAKVSTRRVPPDFVVEYQSIQIELLAGASTWPRWAVTEASGALVEIDGELGLRPVPPGRHFVVVRRLGHAPQGQILHTDEPWTSSASPELLAKTFRGPQEAQAICDRLEVDHVLAVERRQERWGLQAFACGVGFAMPIFAPEEELAMGMRRAFEGPFVERPLALAGPWPEDVPPAAAVQQALREAPPPPSEPAARPWYRRAWVWAVLSAAVIGGVTTAAVLSTRPTPPGRVDIPGPDFIGP